MILGVVSATLTDMEWFIIGGGVLIAITFVATIFSSKSSGTQSVSSRFNFDSYKDQEFAQRGLLDKSKWR